jgi:RHS repeat-associated protein
VYNALNQLSQDIGAAGTMGVTTTYGYDNNGNQTTVNAPLSRNTTNQYDELNRLKQITDAGSGNTSFGYDANDNLTSIQDPKTLSTAYTYNGFGDQKTLVSPDTGATTNTYDSGGNLATSTDSRNAISTYTYDTLNRVKTVAYKIGSTTDQTITYTYDAGTNGKGRLTGASDANHSMSWTYDAQGRVISKGQTVGTVTKTVGYAFTNGDLTTLTTPSGQSVVFAYTNHRISGITINGTTLLSSVQYEPFGPARGWTWGNGTSEVRLHNTDGNTSQTSGLESVTYGYDNAFRITSATNGSNAALSWTYGYDALDRLTSASKTGTTQGWTYDANGNRLTQTGTVSGAYTISPTSNRLSSITGAPARTYTYSNAGSALTFGTVTNTYYNKGRLKTAKVGSSTTTYVYNALGQRVKKSGGTAGTVLYAYDESGHVLGEYDSGGGLVEETIWLEDTPVATLRPGTPAVIYYVHADQLSAPRMVTRPSDNKIAWRWDTDAFGTSTPNENPQSLGTFKFNPRFPGQIFDSETSISYNYLRNYDSQIGRYEESDPIGLKGGINTYGYAATNPISNFDPDGLLSQAVTACVCSNMKLHGYSAWQAWSAALANRNSPGPWNDAILRPCENYLYAFAAVVDYGDPAWFVDVGVFGHDFLKRIGKSHTSPPSAEARAAGYEGASDGASRKDWKKQCEGGCSH